MTDLKAAAEAAKAAQPGTSVWDRAWYRFRDACTPDAILALYAERDEAIRRGENQFAVWVKCDVERRGSVARAEAAEASLASYKEEVERLRGVLETIANLHIPDQPAHFGGEELEWAQRHVGTLRRLAIEALTKEPPHAE